MADKCAGCTNKYKYFERPSICAKCHRGFCQTCLPYQGKKVKKMQPQIATEMCVYCSKQRSINKSEEEDILNNFQERFYKNPHTEPPIQSRLRLDLVIGKARGNSSPQSDPKVMQLSEEDKILEERLRKLKESHEKTTPSCSEEELRDKLEHLRGDGNNKVCGDGGGKKNDNGSKGEGGNNGGGKTQTEESDQLMEKATDEVRLDNQLRVGSDVTEEDLRRRLQALKGSKSSSSSVGVKEQVSQVKLDIKTLVDGMDDPFLLEDSPEKLLNDLIAFQSKESKNALTEVDSADVQFMLEKARELAKQEGASSLVESEGGNDDILLHIVYPVLPDGEGDGKEKTANSPENEAEIAKAIQQGLEEVQIEHEDKSKDMDYIKQTSEQLARLRAKEREMVISDDEVVRNKPKPKPGSRLDFSWGHFSAHSAPSFSQDQSGIVGRDLPNSAREEFNDEVQDLITRTLEEAELDRRLEASGLKYQTEDTPTQNKTMDSGDSENGGGAAAATSSPPFQTAVPRIVCEPDDLPWCCICNDDATIHCYDCDDDLYCQRCFSEGHKQFGLFDHHYEMFGTPGK